MVLLDSTMDLHTSTLVYYSLSLTYVTYLTLLHSPWLYLALLDFATRLMALNYTIALLDSTLFCSTWLGSTWLYYTPQCLYLALSFYSTLLWLYCIVLYSTTLYPGSTWLYTSLYCILLWLFIALLDFTGFYTSLALLGSHWLQYILPWLWYSVRRAMIECCRVKWRQVEPW